MVIVILELSVQSEVQFYSVTKVIEEPSEYPTTEPFMRWDRADFPIIPSFNFGVYYRFKL